MNNNESCKTNQIDDRIRFYKYSNTKKSFKQKYNISQKTINKYLIKYDIPYRKNLNTIKINRDKNERLFFDIFEKPETSFIVLQ